MRNILLILTLIYIPLANCQELPRILVNVDLDHFRQHLILESHAYIIKEFNEDDKYLKSYYSGKANAYLEICDDFHKFFEKDN